jgi:hypothetical protein
MRISKARQVYVIGIKYPGNWIPANLLLSLILNVPNLDYELCRLMTDHRSEQLMFWREMVILMKTRKWQDSGVEFSCFADIGGGEFEVVDPREGIRHSRCGCHYYCQIL